MVLILMVESNVEMISQLPHVVLVVPKIEKIISVAALAISDQSNWSSSLYCCSTFWSFIFFLGAEKNFFQGRIQCNRRHANTNFFTRFSEFSVHF